MKFWDLHSISGWLQLIVNLVTIIVGLVGFYHLRGQIKDEKRKITSLETFAEQSKEHTKQLALQVEQMIESNKLKNKELKYSEEHLAISKMINLRQDEERALSDKKRKMEIQPFFKYHTFRRSPEEIQFSIKNDGETAKIISYEKLTNNNMTFNIDNYTTKSIKRDDTINLFLRSGFPAVNPSMLYLNLKIIYEDIDGNQYYQVIEGKGNESIIVKEPVTIDKMS